jgi:hypothetical protein
MVVSKMKVDQLRAELRTRGLDTAGTKPVLLARLQEALNGAAVDRAGGDGHDTSAGRAAVAAPVASDTDAAAAAASPTAPEVTSDVAQVSTAAGAGQAPEAPVPASAGAGPLNDYSRLTLEQRVEARFARFGGTPEARLAARAKKFGTANGDCGGSAAEQEPKGSLTAKARPADTVSAEEAARREKRAKRFA